ncbi:MAG: threonine--tRNA ligase [Bacilli bacterium]|nr:threonine--tRNA ligase [Bacilli bacterium]
MINIKEDKRLNTLNHSCAHLLAQAVMHLYKDAKLWVGPVIDEGFYYDIDLNGKTLTEDDLNKISKEMKKLAKDGKRIYREELTKKEALEKFKDNPYKVDIIEKISDDEIISCYSQGDFTDLCRGPHVDSLKECKNFKLLKFSGSYYKGDSKNKVLQRIYGVCFDSKEALENHLKELEEAKERDHRKIGKELGIFMMNDLVGKGLPIWLPDGYTLWRTIQNYITDKEITHGYKHVHTPDLGNVNLYKTSGHFDHYQEDMFPIMDLDNEQYVLRPMNCPHHMVIFGNKLHSYKDLPIRIAEIANDFRYEAAGAVKGIERARCFTQNDSHIFCTKDQIKSEFKGVLNLIIEVYKDFNIDITKNKFRLSLRDEEDKVKYFQDDEMWNSAESALREVLDELKVDYFEAKGEAAFYGPKLDILIKPAVGNEVAIPTIQLDFLLPRKFDLKYINDKGEKETPIVIHRAILGSLDRFIAFLLEETKGALPLWLSPNQINIIPVNNEYHLDYCKNILEKLDEFRVKLDSRDEKLSYKMRESQIKKIPYTLVLGDKEKEEGLVSYRKYSSKETVSLKLKDFIKMIKKEIEEKR